MCAMKTKKHAGCQVFVLSSIFQKLMPVVLAITFSTSQFNFKDYFRSQQKNPNPGPTKTPKTVQTQVGVAVALCEFTNVNMHCVLHFDLILESYC